MTRAIQETLSPEIEKLIEFSAGLIKDLTPETIKQKELEKKKERRKFLETIYKEKVAQQKRRAQER